jgi:hypothetical protein
MKIGCCRECSYWMELPEFEAGECHHKSPGLKLDPHSAVTYPTQIAAFPPMRAGDWCGDFHFISAAS